MKNPEDRFQHELVMFFGQTWPQYQGRLFEVYNNPKNEAHGAHRKSMGMQKSVSDLVLQVPLIGIFAGIECKAPGSKHSRDLKILPQLNWGLETIKNGGFYIMTSNMELLMQFTTALIKNDTKTAISLQSIALKFVTDQLKNKTIKF